MREDEGEWEKVEEGGAAVGERREMSTADQGDVVCLGRGFGTHTTLPLSSRVFTLKSVHLLEPGRFFLFVFLFLAPWI